MKIWNEIWDYVKMIIIVVVVVLVINNVVLINAKIPSESMENTIMTGDRIFGFRLAYGFNMNVFGNEISKKWKDPERFDIVIFKYPDDESQLFIKRIIGLPGDKVEIIKMVKFISMILKHHWMIRLYRRHRWEVSDHMKYRRTVIL